MKKWNYANFFKNKFNLFDVKKNLTHNALIIDRGKGVDILASSMIMRIVNRKLKLNPLIYSTNSKNSWQMKMYSSIGKYKFIHSKDILFFFKTIYLLPKSFIYACIGYIKFDKDFLSFINKYTIDGVGIGHCIYDEYIKDHQRYKDENIYNLNFFYYIFRKNYIFFKMQYILKTNKIKTVICNSTDYATPTALASRIALVNKKKVIIADKDFNILKNIKELDNSHYKKNSKHLKLIFNNNKKINYKNYLIKRFFGLIQTSYTDKLDLKLANKNKIRINKKNFIQKYSPNNNFDKIVLIAPHAFTDSVHGFGKRFIFADTYQQTVQTIKFISNHKNKDILWILKKHPRTKHYKEEGQIEKIYAKYKKNNIILLDKSISTISAINLSDLVITGRGSIGLEAASLGKRVIIAGYAVYENLGFTIQPKNIKSYFREIMKASNFEPLNSSQKKIAGKYLYFLDHYKSFELPENEIWKDIDTLNTNQSFKKISDFLIEKKYLKNEYYLKLEKIFDTIKI